MLSDRTIRAVIERGDIEIKPAPEDRQFQPVSIDLRLGAVDSSPVGRTFGNGRDEAPTSSSWWIHPGQFVLASTLERVHLKANVAGQVHGKSSWARLGLQVHAAGLVDPGFDGELTLELWNMGREIIELNSGDLVAQIAFCFLSCTPDRPYGAPGLFSHYQGQTGPTAARP